MDIANSLHVACMLNDTIRVKELLHAGAHRNSENASGSTALELADFLRRVEIVKLLLHDINIKEEGSYELLRAIRVHRMTVVQALLEMGMKEELGQNQALFKGLLTMTCCVGNAAVLETLVKYGPENGVLSFRDVLVQCALAVGNIEVVDGIGRIVSNERGIRANNVVGLDLAPYIKEQSTADLYRTLRVMFPLFRRLLEKVLPRILSMDLSRVGTRV